MLIVKLANGITCLAPSVTELTDDRDVRSSASNSTGVKVEEVTEEADSISSAVKARFRIAAALLTEERD